MGLAETAIAAVSAAIPEAITQLRFNGRNVVSGVSGGATTMRGDTDEGQANLVAARVRCLASALPSSGCGVGDAVEVKPYGVTTWLRARIGSRTQVGGGVFFEIAGEFEQ